MCIPQTNNHCSELCSYTPVVVEYTDTKSDFWPEHCEEITSIAAQRNQSKSVNFIPCSTAL